MTVITIFAAWRKNDCVNMGKDMLIRIVSKDFSHFRHKIMGSGLTQAESFLLGVGAKMFTIAGPVIVYDLSAGVVYGFIYWLTAML